MEVSNYAPLQAGPEVEFFANKLDDCLDYQHSKASTSDKRDRILELVDTYHSYATERAGRGAPNTLRRGPAMDVDSVVIKQEDDVPYDDRHLWEAEAQTWDLLRRLLPLRYPDPSGGSKDKNMRKSLRQSTATRHTAWDEFLASDPVAMERRAVLQWLQANAAEGPSIDDIVRDLQQRADRSHLVAAHGWIHTRTAIKHHKTMLNRTGTIDPNDAPAAQGLRASNGSTLVTQLDPDALARQGRKLQPQDEFFERAIWRGCYELLRRGSSMDTIRGWCSERTEVWRAVTMSALPLPGADSDKPTQGPVTIALWRRMCYASARQGGIDDYERAVYGLLAGDIPSVERVCNSWDDMLFAHYNALLRTQFDKFALEACGPDVAANLGQLFASFDALQYHGEAATLEKRLIKSMVTHSFIGDEGKNPFKVLQGAVLARDLNGYFVEQGLALASGVLGTTDSDVISTQGLNTLQIDNTKLFDSDHIHGLRIVSHVYIIIGLLEKLLGPAPSNTLAVNDARKHVQGNITVAYLNLVSRAGLIELMPMYCSTLAGPRQYEVMSRNLLQVVDRDVRIQVLEIIRRSGLDVLTFVRVQPQLQLDALLKSELPNEDIFSILPSTDEAHVPTELDFMGSSDQIPVRHELLIRSLEWLLLVDEAWPDVLNMTSRVFKYFLKNLRLVSARELLVRVPFEAFLEVRMAKAGRSGEEPVDVEDEAFWSSQLRLLDVGGGNPPTVQEVVVDARDVRDLSSLVKVLDNMETISSLAHLASESEGYREPWAEVVKVMDDCRTCLHPIIGDWLVTSIKNGDDDLQKIRSIYLAETVLGWINTLRYVGKHKGKDYLMECMDLAAHIADGESEIAKVFMEGGRMTELVEAFTACSKEIAVASIDKKASLGKRMRKAGWSRDLWSVQS